MSTTSKSEGVDSPIDNFSQCHVGIVSHLLELAQLPALLEPAAKARRIAAETVKFFRSVVVEHHAQEEQDLFPAVLASAVKGDERDQIKVIVDRLVAEHRMIEATWSKLEPELHRVGKGHDCQLDASVVESLVADYQAHARYEEEVFLPLSQRILGRNGDHMAALGLTLHLRHAVPDLLARFGGRI